MTWPASDVNTTNTDSDADTPVGAAGVSAREDILDLIQKFNQLRAHVTAAAQGLLDDADATAMRSTLGLAALAIKNTVATADIDADAVTYAKMQNVSATDKLIGRSTAGAGDPEEIACTAAGRALIGGADAAAQLALLVAAGQIPFPATQNPSAGANVLDDYEEGTWTPSVGGTATYTTQVGTYTKIGRQVFFSATVTINVLGTGSTTVISGLPFTNSDAESIISANAAVSATAVVSMFAFMLSGSANVTLASRTAASASAAVNPIFQNGTTVSMTGSYRN